jgi:hypothetical protein
MTLQSCRINEPPYKIIIDGRPPTDIVNDVLYVPEGYGGSPAGTWGVFGRDRRLIPGTAYYRGPGPHLPFQKPFTEVDTDAVRQIAPDVAYIYGGRVVPHYGHFLLGCLPRFWRQNDLSNRNLKILIHSPHDLDTLFAQTHIAGVFGALGLSIDSFAIFTEPTRIPELLVPWPSFEEGHLAYPEFANLCHGIGEQLLGGEKPALNLRPVYFSKERMSSGISRLSNEAEFTKILQQNGIEIVYPELMDLRSQIRTFAERQILAGSFGSVFHTSIFVKSRRMLMLNWGDTVYRNFSLIDEINGNSTHYMFPNHEIEICGSSGGFGANWRLLNPESVARQFLLAVEALSGRARGSGLSNLAFGRPTLQSTYAADHQPTGIVKEGSAVDGRLSSTTAFHTSYEAKPWWQVDLGSNVRVKQLRLFNVVGPTFIMERASRFRCLVSEDGTSWDEVFRRTDASSFGGIDGQPFEWTPEFEVKGRYLRIELLDAQFFHLDQVQVYGYHLS